MGGRTAELGLENRQRAANAMTANVHGAARLGKADQRHQNMVQAERQQQAFSGAEDHRSEIPGAIDDLAEGINSHGENRPDQRDHQTDQAENHGSNNWNKAGAAKKGQRVGQADIVKTLMQHPDDDPGDHRAKDPGIDRLNTDNILNVIRFEDGGIGGRQNAFGRQPEVNRQIHHGVADKTGKRGDALVFPGQAQRNGDTKHHRQKAEGKRADFAHPDENGLQQRHVQPRQERQDIMAAQRAADPQHDPAKGEQRHG